MPRKEEAESLIAQIDEVAEDLSVLLSKLGPIVSLPQAYHSLRMNYPPSAHPSFKEFVNVLGKVRPELKTVGTELQGVKRRFKSIANACDVLYPDETRDLTVALHRLDLDAKSLDKATLDEFKSGARLLKRLKAALARTPSANPGRQGSTVSGEPGQVTANRFFQLERFDQLRLRFANDGCVQVFCPGCDGESYTCEQLGFMDGRSRKGPIIGWATLQDLARREGRLERLAFPQKEWSSLETRVKSIRDRFRVFFACDDNPIRWIPRDKVYETVFKVGGSDFFLEEGP